ncbi:hypothetical protein GCM10010124_24800 [Pilimelia terevasa]|uniref:HTH luxR-type domain-containing protein n=1 Tax=Pilimelia terevasa TaxID=53372 RepID=A0A8J3FHX2_9ACTN|nr:helix-turn-helix transcriptional regulator [Pilimelia terevasa]GGK31004.1 hypothetical protein GCM10010124_24800 [Pilimelia terevasa]
MTTTVDVSGGDPADGPVVPVLTRYGMSPDADLVYRTLTGAGAQSESGLRLRLGLTAAQTARACDELAAVQALRGVTNPGGRSRTWRAAPTGEFLPRLRDRHRTAEYARAKTRQDAATRTGHGAVLLAAGLPADLPPGQLGLRTFPGRSAARSRLVDLSARAREYLAMNPEPVFTDETIAAAAPHDLAMLARGTRMVGLAHPGNRSPAVDAHSRALEEAGSLHRVALDLPTKLIIADRRVAILPLDPGDLAVGAVEIQQPAVVEALVATYLRAFDKAQECVPDDTGPAPLTDREKAVVILLMQGRTDQAIARALGVSTRTVQYTLRALMDRMHVNTRFALGFAIGGSGLLSPADQIDVAS